MGTRPTTSALHTGAAYVRALPLGFYSFSDAGGTPIEAVQTCPVDALSRFEARPPGAVDVTLNLAESVNMAAAWAVRVGHADTAGVEVLQRLAQASAASVDYQATIAAAGKVSPEHVAPLSGSAALRIEWALEIIRPRQISTEQMSGLSASPIVPVFWAGALVVDLAVDLPLDWRADQERAHPAAVDHARDLTIDAALPTDHQARQAVAAEIVIDPLASLDKAAQLPVAWTGAMILEFSADLPLDWQAGMGATHPAPTDSVAVIVVDRSPSVEQLAEVIAARDIQADFVAVVDKAYVLPVDWDGVSGFVAGITRIFKRRTGPATRFADRPGRSWFPVKGARGRGVIFKRRK